MNKLAASKLKVLYSEKEIARRVQELGSQIARDFKGETIHVVGLVDTGHIFMADLIRSLKGSVSAHFVSTNTREIIDPNYQRERKEIFFYPEIEAENRSLLVVDGVLNSGVTMDFLLRRMWLRQPRMVKTVVLLDKVAARRVLLEPDYVGFEFASNDIVVGYGLAWDGLYGNLPYLAVSSKDGAGKTAKGSRRKSSAGRSRSSTKGRK